MRVRICKPTKSVMQSGSGRGLWIVEPFTFLPLQIEPLRGWTRSDDPFSSLRGRLAFHTQGEALTFVQRRGWNYVLDAPEEKDVQPKSYLDNFKPDSTRRTR